MESSTYEELFIGHWISLTKPCLDAQINMCFVNHVNIQNDRDVVHPQKWFFEAVSHGKTIVQAVFLLSLTEDCLR